MTGTTLQLTQMKMADIILVEDWGKVVKDPTHTMIAAGQALLSHGTKASSNVTHAGLFDGCNSILEASGGEGLRSAYFVTVHRGTKYQVYRYRGDKNVPA